MFDFPNSPTEGQIYAPPGGPRYQWNSPVWDVVGASGAGSSDDLWWETRAAFVASVAGGLPISKGKTYTAGGYQYIGADPWAAAIPDLPKLLPLGDIHVEHFGAKGDLAYALQTGLPASADTGSTSGFIRTAGTDDMAAFVLADAYAAGGVYYAGGQYYLLGQFEPISLLKSGNNYEAVIWQRYSGIQTGVRFWTSNAGVVGFRVISQYDSTLGAKPSGGGVGQLATAFCVGEYYSKVQQQRITNITLDVLLCRAGSGAGQTSGGSFLVMPTGWHDHCTFRLGAHGKTNVASNGLILVHWGCWYDTATVGLRGVTVTNGGSGYTTATATSSGGGGGVLAQPQLSATVSGGQVTAVTMLDAGWGLTAPPTITISGDGAGATTTPLWGDTAGYYFASGADLHESYHGMDGVIEITTPIHCMSDGHGFGIIVELAATGPYTVSDIEATGGICCFSYGVGDMVDHYAIPQHKGRVGKGIRTGHLSMLDSRDPGSSVYQKVLYLKGSGTANGSSDRYGDGSTALWQRQVEVDIEIAGLTGNRVVPAALSTAFHGFDLLGRVKVGSIESWGYGRGVEIEHSYADIQFNYIKGDGDIRYEFSSNGRLSETSTNIPTMAAGTYGVSLSGREMTTVTTADVIAGAVKTPITNSLTDAVYVKDKVKIGPYWVEATEKIAPAFAGPPVYAAVPYIMHTPLPGPVTAGASVIVDQRVRAREVNLTSKGGEFGLPMLNSRIDRLNASGFRGAGSHAIRLRGSSVILTGKFPQGAGMNGVAGAYAVWGDNRSSILIEDSTIDADPFLAFLTFFDFVSSTDYGSVTFSRCRIADSTKLFPTAGTSPARQVTMRECIDTSASQFKELVHPFRSGSNANGQFKMMDDGAMICWIRNATTDASGDFTWTYPAPFNGGSTTISVVVTPVTTTNVRVFGTGAPGATTCAIKSRDAAGTAIAAAFNAIATGRWYA